MKLAIVHYHLNRGGVAQVITDQLAGLDVLEGPGAPERVAICYGGRRDDWPEDLAARFTNLDVTLQAIEGLDYDEDGGRPDAGGLAGRLLAVLGELGFDPEDTVLHVHNHALGKNVSLPGAVRILAERGYRQLLQLHDFAEDFRPGNYQRLRTALACPDPDRLGEALYPQADHIHYAVLNRRDFSILRSAGVARDRLHVLPNAVPERACALDQRAARERVGVRCGVPGDRRYLLYPARGIRRKNLGEALLWAALFDSSAHVGLTLPAVDDRERPGYERWRKVAGRLRLRCSFETGGRHGVSIEENFQACDRVMTTSVAEGFGLAFLEGQLVGRGILGRDLPEVTKDFVNDGVTFPGLRDRVDVPEGWLGRRRLVEMFDRRYHSTVVCYGRPRLSDGELEMGVASKIEGAFVDFGDLDASAQEHALASVVDDRRRRSELMDANPWMLDAFDGGRDDHTELARNAETVRAHYSSRAAGSRLGRVYRQLMDAGGIGPIERIRAGGTVLDEFLRFDRFRAVLA